jgi:hypothetical protein
VVVIHVFKSLEELGENLLLSLLALLDVGVVSGVVLASQVINGELSTLVLVDDVESLVGELFSEVVQFALRVTKGGKITLML